MYPPVCTYSVLKANNLNNFLVVLLSAQAQILVASLEDRHAGRLLLLLEMMATLPVSEYLKKFFILILYKFTKE